MNTTVIVPVAPYHNEIFTRALNSVRNQTTPCHLIYMYDEDKRGPGFIRNQLLKEVETPYTVFLDADDWLDEHFIEECERVIKPNRYVYTDWYNPKEYRHAPEFPYCKRAYMPRTWHLVTALLHTTHIRAIGGFDETLPALEDTDFWLGLTAQNICGIHIRKGLIYYSEEGKRGKGARDSGQAEILLDQIMERYKDPMPCCGGDIEIDMSIPIGERQPNDVLAMAKWRGNRKEYGRASGRWYPRMAHPKTTWMDPRDIAMDPNNWGQVIEQAVNDVTPIATNLEVFDRVFHRPKPPTPDPVEVAEIEPIEQPIPLTGAPEFAPDVARIVVIAQERLQDD